MYITYGKVFGAVAYLRGGRGGSLPPLTSDKQKKKKREREREGEGERREKKGYFFFFACQLVF